MFHSLNRRGIGGRQLMTAEMKHWTHIKDVFLQGKKPSMIKMFGGKTVVEVYSEHSKYTSTAFQNEVVDKEKLSP